jgi:hypothetical protein
MRSPQQNRAKKPTSNRATVAKKATDKPKPTEPSKEAIEKEKALQAELVEAGMAYGDAGTYPVSFCIIATYDEFVQHGQRLLRSLPPDAEVCLLYNRPAKAGEQPHLGEVKQHNAAIDLKSREWVYEQGEFSFATARNHAHDMAHHDWIFWIDCDEVLVHSQHIGIRDLAVGLPKGYGGVWGAQASMTDYGGNAANPQSMPNYINIGQVRMYRKSTGARWFGRCHEQIAQSILDGGYAIKATDITVVHSGYVLTRTAMIAKLRRNVALLARQYVEMGINHPLAASYLEMLVRDGEGLIKLGGHHAG